MFLSFFSSSFNFHLDSRLAFSFSVKLVLLRFFPFLGVRVDRHFWMAPKKKEGLVRVKSMCVGVERRISRDKETFFALFVSPIFKGLLFSKICFHFSSPPLSTLECQVFVQFRWFPRQIAASLGRQEESAADQPRCSLSRQGPQRRQRPRLLRCPN